MKRDRGAKIEDAIQLEDWEKARQLVRKELRRHPEDHWLLTRLALTYYEQRDYRNALRFDIKALQKAPYCPLAIWNYAGTLNMLGKNKEALALYRWLISWGEEHLAHGECGEGLPRARSMIADCHYRIAGILDDQKQRKRALKALDQYISLRRRGVRSIYSLRKAKDHYKSIQLAIRKRGVRT